MSQRVRISLFVGLVMIAASTQLIGPSVAAPSAGPGTSGRSTLTNAQFGAQLLALTNAERKKIGCPALKRNRPLTKAARGHSRRMAAARNLSHQLPGEAGLAQRIQRAGYTGWLAAGENIAWGAGTPRRVFSMWMSSSGHRANIQRCFYRDAGFGVVVKNGTPWVTLDLGRRR